MSDHGLSSHSFRAVIDHLEDNRPLMAGAVFARLPNPVAEANIDKLARLITEREDAISCLVAVASGILGVRLPTSPTRAAQLRTRCEEKLRSTTLTAMIVPPGKRMGRGAHPWYVGTDG